MRVATILARCLLGLLSVAGAARAQTAPTLPGIPAGFRIAPAEGHAATRLAAATHHVLVDGDAGGDWQLAPGQDFPLDAVPHGTAVSLRIERAPESHAVRVAGCGGAWVEDLYRTAPVTDDCSVRIDFDLRPVVHGAHYRLLEDEGLLGVVSADDDGGALHYSVRQAPDQGFVSLDTALGTFEYWPHADYNGEDGFAVAASDASGPSSPAWITIDVSPVNDAPSLTLDGPVVESAARPGPRTRSRFATFVAGPEEEPATQAVHGFLIEAIEDPADVVVDASIAIDDAGTLFYALTGRTGTATIAAKVRDTGGVRNGGIDTSRPESFRIVVQPGPDLGVALRIAGDTPVAGEPFRVVVDASNPDAAQGTGARLDVTMPDALAVAWTCVPEASTPACPAPPGDAGIGDIALDLALPASAHLRFVIDAVAPPEGGVLRFDAALVGAQDDDPLPADNAAQLEIAVRPAMLFADGFEGDQP